MELLGLRLFLLCFLLCSCKGKDSQILTYVKREIGLPTSLDTMNVGFEKSTYLIHEKEFRIQFDHNDYVKISLSDGSCQSNAQLELKLGEFVDLECGSIYPIVGERVSMLDKKTFKLKDKEYSVYKLFNETGNSDLNCTTTFWLESGMLILIRARQGEYFELIEFNPDLLKLVKNDTNFSELIPIPPAPPLPDFESKK